MKGTTRFLAHREIKPKLSNLLSQLHQESCLSGLPIEKMADRSAYYLAELNYIHPFREGNGRATREFMRQLFDRLGYEIRWNAVETEQMLLAMEESIYDTAMLRGVLLLCLRQKTYEQGK